MVGIDVAFIPTPKVVVRKMLQLAQLRRGEKLYDLGAGDGRILVEAARSFGARCVGVEIDPNLISRIKERLHSTGTEAEIIEGDLMSVNLRDADVITLYLSESVNLKLAPKLQSQLKSGTRIVSLDYALPGWNPETSLEVSASGMRRTVYLYKVKM